VVLLDGKLKEKLTIRLNREESEMPKYNKNNLLKKSWAAGLTHWRIG